MPPKPITHSQWLRGLQAGFDRFSQPKGCISRVSNMVYTRRGALKTCDGSGIITMQNGVLLPNNSGFTWTEVFLFQPVNGAAGYFGIAKDANSHIGPPMDLTATASGSGVLNGTHYYVVTSLDGNGGESTPNAVPVVITVTNAQVHLNWTPPGANYYLVPSYNLYRSAQNTAGPFYRVNTSPIPQPFDSNGTPQNPFFTDNIPDSGLQQTLQPPSADTTQSSPFFSLPVGSYGSGNILWQFPPDAFPVLPPIITGGPITGPGSGGTTGGSGGGSSASAPLGGTIGTISPIPQILQFTSGGSILAPGTTPLDEMIIALGNGSAPFMSNGTPNNTVPLHNTFVSTFPSWSGGIAFNQGDQIEATAANGVQYIFTATQGGITNGTAGSTTNPGQPPVWPTLLNATVADGPGSTVVWKNSGPAGTLGPPRGAAHIEIYAGSLWVANTSPTTTTDQLDGPSAVRMSDLNDPNSWNPLNSALVDPEDGDQGTGLKAFTIAEAGIAPQNFLMYFKYFSTYLFQGVFGATDFAITRLQTDLGCVAPRTIQFVPGYGIMRLTHLGFAVTDGLSDKLQDPESIRPYLFSESTESDILPVDQSYLWFSKAAQTANPPMYICAVPLLGTSSGIFTGVSVQALQASRITGLALGTWYVNVAATLTNGSQVVGGQASVILVQTSSGLFNQIEVILPTNDPTVASWQIYLGQNSGRLNQYVPVPFGAPNIIINGLTVLDNGTPPVSQNGWLTRLFCYDLVIKAWTIVDLPFPISVLHQARIPGSQPITYMAGFEDGAIRRWQMGDGDWDPGAVNNAAPDNHVRWGFTDAELFNEAGTNRLFHNLIIIRGDGGPVQVQVTPTAHGRVQATINAALLALGRGQYEARVRVMQTLENLNLTISGVGPATVESVSDLIEEKPLKGALVIS